MSAKTESREAVEEEVDALYVERLGEDSPHNYKITVRSGVYTTGGEYYCTSLKLNDYAFALCTEDSVFEMGEYQKSLTIVREEGSSRINIKQNVLE